LGHPDLANEGRLAWDTASSLAETGEIRGAVTSTAPGGELASVRVISGLVQKDPHQQISLTRETGHQNQEKQGVN
jgi:hypothetical protein